MIIARNTSSESARIATIPGRSTIGIELPNSSRENVYLSEIFINSDFTKKDIRLPIALGKNNFWYSSSWRFSFYATFINSWNHRVR